MSTNLTIESPNFDKIEKEAGQFTSDAISTLWQALNYYAKVFRTDIRLSRDLLEPKVKQVSAAASVDNMDLEGCSVVEFTGGSAQNFTGMRAPETGKTRMVLIYVSGAGTITIKHGATSETGNQFDTASAADVALATRGQMIVCYLSGKWREIA